MTIIFHLSDLMIDNHVTETLHVLLGEISDQKPDLVIISGDITRKGRTKNFEIAQGLIQSLNVPVFAVSGDKDIQAFSLMDPFKNFRAFISPIQDCVYEDNQVYVVGINTARPLIPHWKWSNGMVSQDQIQFVHNQFRQAENEKVRIFVCHHPLVRAGKGGGDSLVWGSTDILNALQDQQVDLVLTSYAKDIMFLPDVDAPSGPVMIGCSTGCVNAKKQSRAGYNIIHINPDTIKIDTMQFDGKDHLVTDMHEIIRPKDDTKEQM